MKDSVRYFKFIWNQALTNRYFAAEFISSALFLVLVMMIFSRFVEFVELRKGMQFNDPILLLFKAKDFTNIIFTFIYGAIIIALLSLVSSPYRLMILLESYALMVLCRLLMMYSIPLAPPEGMIMLKDPFVEFFGTGKTLINDLFFSGHTATMCLLVIAVPKKLKWIFFIAMLIVAAGVLLQKVHYTVDVLVAPFVSYTSYKLVSDFVRHRYIGELE